MKRLIVLSLIAAMIMRIYIFIKLYIPGNKHLISKQVKKFIAFLILWIPQEGTWNFSFRELIPVQSWIEGHD